MALAVPNAANLTPENIGETLMAYSAMETAVIRRMLRATRFCSRTYEAQLQNANVAMIPTRNNVVTATAFARGGNWKDLQATGYTLQPFQITESSEVGNEILREDIREGLSLLLMASTADDQGEAHAERINTDLYDQMWLGAGGDIPLAVTGEKGAVNAAWVDDAGHIHTAGDGELADDFMLDNLRAIELFWIRRKLLYVGRQNTMPDVIMSESLWINLRDYLLKAKLADILNMTLLQGQGDIDPSMPVAIIFSMRIWVDPELRAHDADGNEDSANLHGILTIAPTRTRAFQFASVPPVAQFLTPAINQTGPNYALRGIREWGRKATDGHLIGKIAVRRSQNG